MNDTDIQPDSGNQGPTTIPIVCVQDDVANEVPIKLDSKAMSKIRKRKQMEALAEAKAFQLVGAQVIRIKNRTLAKIGDHIDKMGVKKIGHGQLSSAAQNADESLAECDKLIAELQANRSDIDPKVILDIMELKLKFNRQKIELGHAHLEADRKASEAIQGAALQIPFPPGQSMTISKPPLSGPAVEEKQLER